MSANLFNLYQFFIKKSFEYLSLTFTSSFLLDFNNLLKSIVFTQFFQFLLNQSFFKSVDKIVHLTKSFSKSTTSGFKSVKYKLFQFTVIFNSLNSGASYILTKSTAFESKLIQKYVVFHQSAQQCFSYLFTIQ